MKGLSLSGSLCRIAFVALLVHVGGQAGYRLTGPEIWLLLAWLVVTWCLTFREGFNSH